jgi:hypothetical protein
MVERNDDETQTWSLWQKEEGKEGEKRKKEEVIFKIENFFSFFIRDFKKKLIIISSCSNKYFLYKFNSQQNSNSLF